MIHFWKKIKILGFVVVFSVGGLWAQGAYMGYGLGLQLNLGDLGSTITKDGLSNRYGTQKIIIPENTIDVYRNSGLATGKTTGAMTGLLLSVFYEVDSTNTFWRVGAEYTRKVLGGHSKAQIAGYTFIDQNWDFNSLVVPLYWGLKANLGETSSVYAGLGINYFRGGWSLSGTVDGATPCKVAVELAGSAGQTFCGLGPNGVGLINPLDPVEAFQYATLPPNNIPLFYPLPKLARIFGAPQLNIPPDLDKLYDGAIFGEKVVFDVSGIGFNFMIGVDAKMQGGNKLYFEIEYLLDAKMDNAPVRSQGTINQLAPLGNISYPIVIGGIRYKFGYKMPAAF